MNVYDYYLFWSRLNHRYPDPITRNSTKSGPTRLLAHWRGRDLPAGVFSIPRTRTRDHWLRDQVPNHLNNSTLVYDYYLIR